jgi:hypothetical protein
VSVNERLFWILMAVATAAGLAAFVWLLRWLFA